MNWLWVCRDCKKEYPENCEGLVSEVQFLNRLVIKCPCGGMVDLCPLPRVTDDACKRSYIRRVSQDGMVSS